MRPLAFRLAVLAFLTALFALVESVAANPVSSENATVTLVPERMAVQPGETVAIGLHQQIREGWHTYWRNPGDSGEPTRIHWELPEGATASDIRWPAPERIPYGPLTNYGYSDEVLLLSEVTVPADWPVGEPLVVDAHATWLICSDVCIPEDAALTLELPVTAEPGLDNALWRAEFADARAALPDDSPWQAHYSTDDGMSLRLVSAGIEPDRLEDVYFFPFDWGLIDHAAPQPWRMDGGDLVVEMTSGMAPPQEGSLGGVLTLVERLDEGPVRHAFHLQAEPTSASGAAMAGSSGGSGSGGAGGLPTGDGPVAGGEIAGPTFLAAVGLALLGGLILNLMPCVFPVLSMKAMALVRQAHGDARHARLEGLAYTAGILVAFAAVAGVLIAMQAGGAQVGWGFQLQSPVFVAVLAYVLFAVGLSLSGVFTVGGSLVGAGSSLAGRDGLSGAFFTGVLATVVATPCTAPFMGAAVGFALTQPWAVSLTVFLALGLGLALPYLVLSLRPTLLRFLPRPGAWMDRLKQALAFPMYASAAWLVWVLALQVGPDGVLAALGGMLAIAFAAWVWSATRQAARGWRVAGIGLAAAAVVVALVLARGDPVGLSGPARTAMAAAADGAPGIASDEVEDAGAWQPFSAERLEALRADGRPVFVNMTAAWCITCLVNERVALSSDRVVEAMREAGIAYLKGDWTNRNDEITRYLDSFGRSGVPLYVFYPASPEAEPRLLPQILTEAQVMDALGLG